MFRLDVGKSYLRKSLKCTLGTAEVARAMYKMTPSLVVIIAALVFAVLVSVFFSLVLRADDPRWPLLIPLFACIVPLLCAGKRIGFVVCIASALFLLAFSMIAAASVGLFYLPSVVLIIIAALLIRIRKFKDAS